MIGSGTGILSILIEFKQISDFLGWIIDFWVDNFRQILLSTYKFTNDAITCFLGGITVLLHSNHRVITHGNHLLIGGFPRW